MECWISELWVDLCLECTVGAHCSLLPRLDFIVGPFLVFVCLYFVYVGFPTFRERERTTIRLGWPSTGGILLALVGGQNGKLVSFCPFIHV